MMKETEIPNELEAKLNAAGIHSVEDLIKAPTGILESLSLSHEDALAIQNALVGVGVTVLLLPFGVPGAPDPKALEALGRMILDYHLRAQLSASSIADKVIEWIDLQKGAKT